MREAGRPTVMVAHNDEDTRSLLKFWLESEGYDVIEAADGQEAVRMIRGRCPDLILLAERMPNLGGLETARRILEESKECALRIVAMSSYPTKEARAAAAEAGCDCFIPQPLDFDLLGDLLKSLLRGAAAGRRKAAEAASHVGSYS